MKRFVFATALTLIAAGASQAAIINVAVRPGINTINDRDVARLIDTVGANDRADVGDSVESLLIFDNISNSQFGATPLEVAVGDASYQLTAHIMTTVISKVFLNAGPDAIGGNNDDLFLFHLVMTANVYEDNSALANTILTDFSSQSAAAAITAGTDGSLILTLTAGTGLTSGATTPGGAPGALDVFRIISADDFSQLTTGNEANFILASSIAANPGLVPILADFTRSGAAGVPPGTGDFHDVVGVGEEEVASGAVVNQGWDTQSDTTISFTAIPEPMSLLVWSALTGLVGLAVYRRRKQD